MFRIRRACIVPLVLGVALVPGVDAAQAQKAKRRGGEVREAWPANAKRKAPSKPLVRWLARQVGPTTPAAKKKARKAGVAFAAQSAGGSSLLLIRSFDIPTSDAAYGRLTDASYTYDNALATLRVPERRRAVAGGAAARPAQGRCSARTGRSSTRSTSSRDERRAGAGRRDGVGRVRRARVQEGLRLDQVRRGDRRRRALPADPAQRQRPDQGRAGRELGLDPAQPARRRVPA